MRVLVTGRLLHHDVCEPLLLLQEARIADIGSHGEGGARRGLRLVESQRHGFLSEAGGNESRAL